MLARHEQNIEYEDSYVFSFCVLEDRRNFDVCGEVMHNMTQVGRLGGCRLMRRHRGFHNECNEDSEELRDAGLNFCDYCGYFRDRSLPDSGGYFLFLDKISIDTPHRGKDIGIHFLHALLSWLTTRHPWAIAVLKVGIIDGVPPLLQQVQQPLPQPHEGENETTLKFQQTIRKIATQYYRLGFKQKQFASMYMFLLPSEMSLKTKQEVVVPDCFWAPKEEYTEQDKVLRQLVFDADPVFDADCASAMVAAISSGANADRSLILHEAAFKNDAATVVFLLQVLGCSVNLQDSSGYTPLHLAVDKTAKRAGTNAQVATVQELLNYGAEKQTEDKGGHTAASIALIRMTDELDRMRVHPWHAQMVDCRILELVIDGLIDQAMSPRMHFQLRVAAEFANDTMFDQDPMTGLKLVPTSQEDLMWLSWYDPAHHPENIEDPRQYALGFAVVVRAIFQLLEEGRLPTSDLVDDYLGGETMYYFDNGGTVDMALAGLLSYAYEQITFCIGGDRVSEFELDWGDDEELQAMPVMPDLDENFGLICNRMGLPFAADPSR